MKTTISRAAAIGALASLAAIGLSHSAEAMSISNCTTNGADFTVVSQDTGKTYMSTRLEPGQRVIFPAPRNDKMRVAINVIGPDLRYSNRRASEEIRLTILRGSYELVAGLDCVDGG